MRSGDKFQKETKDKGRSSGEIKPTINVGRRCERTKDDEMSQIFVDHVKFMVPKLQVE